MRLSYQKHLEACEEYDVLVCGGGPAGFPAAIAAARLGVRVGLIERSNMLGGIMTTGRNNDVALFCAGARPIISGVGWEFIQRLGEEGYADIPVFASGVSHPEQGVRVNITMAAELMDRMCGEAKVDVHFFHCLIDVAREDDRWIVVCASREGLRAIAARWIVDCTGDGDACVLVGADYELGGEDGELQPGTLGFYLTRDTSATWDEDALRVQFKVSQQTGELMPWDVWPSRATPAMALRNRGINVGHVAADRDYAKKRSDIEREGRRSVARLQRWFDKYAPQAKAAIMGTAPEVALRETRRIVCESRITGEDYARGALHEDDVCYSFYPIDLHIHDAKGRDSIYCNPINEEHVPGIPFGALVPKGVPNMLVAGRCIGGDRLAQSAFRTKASCMATGQAAGTAAALGCFEGTVAIDKLRRTLHEAGAIVPGME